MANQIIQSIQPAEDEIDLSKLFGIMIDAKWFIIGVTLFFSVFGIAFALLSTPIYKADALIQIEKKALVSSHRLLVIWESYSRQNLRQLLKLRF